ncbi:hypothetical protein [Vibrio harveyi]|uniref:hypothetical protein n=1 Tax=Vibrio harveyi TaxID=669 RepID=UPI002380B566|nr:hypothetical protein [Vibrio harveyi]
MSNTALLSAYMGTWFCPLFIFGVILGVGVIAKKRNIAANSIGFLLIMLSILMSAVTTFSTPEIPNNLALSDEYKLVGFVCGLVGTAVCAFVAFHDQAKS